MIVPPGDMGRCANRVSLARNLGWVVLCVDVPILNSATLAWFSGTRFSNRPRILETLPRTCIFRRRIDSRLSRWSF